VSCPAENTWLAYVGGELEGAAVDRLDHHLDTCPACRQLYVGIARDDGHAATQPAVPSPWPLGSARERDALDLPRGTAIGRYMVLGQIGRGGMGVVYKAYDPELDRAIALKLVAFDGLAETGADALRQRLLREAKTLAQLSHPNVVAVYDVGTFGEHSVFVAMEFVAGRSLKSWLGAELRRARDILAVFAAAGAGLAAAHEQGIVHRDFKPENVMVGDDGRVRVLDFGLARSPGGRVAARPSLVDVEVNEGSAQLTREGSVLGTPAYMAPEQDAGDEVDARGDQFSFCASLYEALFGQRPFGGTTYLEMAARRAAGEVQAPPAVRGVRARVRAAVLRGLRSAPAERHGDMDALLAELGKRPWYGRTRVALAALALAALAAAGWAVWTARHAPPSVEETCAAAAHEIDRTWNAERKQALEKQFLATGHPRAQVIAYHVQGTIDDWTGAWAKERATVCEIAMRPDGDHETHAADRLQCLQNQFSTFAADVAVMTTTTLPEVVSSAESIFAKLPQPARCQDLAIVKQTSSDIDAMKPVIDDIVKIQVDEGAGHIQQAVEDARSAVRRARELGSPAEAVALYKLGEAQMMGGEVTSSGDTLREAVVAATRIRDDGIVLDAWLAIIALAVTSHRYDWHTEQAMFGAELAAMHVPADDPRRASLPFREGTVRIMIGDLDGAERQLRASELEWRKLGAELHVIDLAGVDNSRGFVAMMRGDAAEAHRLLERSLAVWQKLPPNTNTVATLGVISSLLDSELRHDEARAMRLRTLDAATKLPEINDKVLGEEELGLALHDAQQGHCEQSVDVLARAEQRMAKVYGRESAAFGMVLLTRAMCELERGDVTAAIEHLEHARSLAADHPISVVQVPGIEFVLSHARRRHGDVKQADELAAASRAGIAKMPGLRPLYDELDHHLASIPR
jgi:predicted Ser/Thr protein kinase/tetratricopeptide (TPR) repeat protein